MKPFLQNPNSCKLVTKKLSQIPTKAETIKHMREEQGSAKSCTQQAGLAPLYFLNKKFPY
jgi:hypothetical protein